MLPELPGHTELNAPGSGPVSKPPSLTTTCERHEGEGTTAMVLLVVVVDVVVVKPAGVVAVAVAAVVVTAAAAVVVAVARVEPPVAVVVDGPAVVVVVSDGSKMMIELSGILAADDAPLIFQLAMSLMRATQPLRVAPPANGAALNRCSFPALVLAGKMVAVTLSVRFGGMSLELADVLVSAEPVSSNMHSVVYDPLATGFAALMLCKPITWSPEPLSAKLADLVHR